MSPQLSPPCATIEVHPIGGTHFLSPAARGKDDKEMTHMITYSRLWLLLKKRGYSPRDIIYLAGISESTYRKMSRNEAVRMDVLERISLFPYSMFSRKFLFDPALLVFTSSIMSSDFYRRAPRLFSVRIGKLNTYKILIGLDPIDLSCQSLSASASIINPVEV